MSDDPAPLDLRIFEAAVASLEMLSIHLGRRLGLYGGVAAPGGVTADELATVAGIAPRYAVEWLEQQAVAGFVNVDDPDAAASARRFRLTDASAPPSSTPKTRPTSRRSPTWSPASAASWTNWPRPTDAAPACPTPGSAHTCATARAASTALPTTRPCGTGSTNGTGVRIADVGCGQGWSTIALARAYPHAEVIGFASIDDALRHAAAAGVEVTFQVLPAGAVAGHGPFDLVVVLETLHDLAHPVDALVACRAALRRGGAVVVADEMVADRFTAPGDETERFMYGFSVLHCLPASLAEEGSAALGTVLRAPTVHRIAAAAGFNRCADIDVPAGFFRIYELTP